MPSEKQKKLYTKVVARTLFYQLLILFMGISIGFIFNAEYIGNRAPIIERSVAHIFQPRQYDEELEMQLIDFGKSRLWVFLGCPNNLTCYNTRISGQEWFETDYTYETAEGGTVDGEYRTRIKWKPWELYYLSNEQ